MRPCSIIACILLLASGCIKKSSDTAQPPLAPTNVVAAVESVKAAAVAPDPVAEMKKCVQHLENYYNVEHRMDKGDITHRVKEIAYDVQKTDSLISPFSGYVTYEEIVAGDEPDGVNRIELAFQENHWVVKGALFRLKSDGENAPWKQYPSFLQDGTKQLAKINLGL